jgi:glycosyltransferase 2 family protein
VILYLFWTAAFVRFAEACLRRIRFVPEAARHKFAAILESGAAGLMAIKRVRDMVGVLAISVVHWALNGLVIYLSLRAFSIDVSWAACLVLMGGVAIMVAFPSAPGFFGIIQLGFMLVLGAFVQDQESVFAASIYYHMCGYIPVTLSGVTYFILTGMKLSEVRQVAEQKRDEPVEDMLAQPAGGAVAAVPSGIGAGTENE